MELVIVSITEAMQKITAIEESITAVVGDVGYKVEKAYSFQPSGLDGKISTPSFINYVSLQSITGANGGRTRVYQVRAHFFLAERGSSLAEWSQVAAEFHQQFLDAFGEAVMLHETNVIVKILSNEGSSEIPAGLFWNAPEGSTNPTHYGLEFLLELQITDSFDWSA